MSRTLRLPLRRPLARIRVHPFKQEGGAPVGKAALIYDLKQREADRAAERQTVSDCLQSIERNLEAIPQLVGQNLTAIAAMSTEIGLTLAREIVHDVLERGLFDPTPAVLRCLENVVEDASEARLRILLHPEDLQLVLEKLEAASAVGSPLERASFEVDPALNRGSVRVESGAGRMLYDPMEVLGRISEEVRRESQG